MAIWHENTQDLWEIPLSEGWHRHSRTFPMPQNAAVAHSTRRAMPISQARLPCQQQTVWTDEWRPAVPHFPAPDLRYYRTPEDLSSPKGEGKYGEPKETDCLFVFVFVSSVEWRLRFGNQIFIEDQLLFLIDLSFWIETHIPKVNTCMIIIAKTKVMGAQKKDLTQASWSWKTSLRRWYVSWDLQNRVALETLGAWPLSKGTDTFPSWYYYHVEYRTQRENIFSFSEVILNLHLEHKILSYSKYSLESSSPFSGEG